MIDPLDTDHTYIATRIIGCFLREDVRGIVSFGQRATPPDAVLAVWSSERSVEQWWRIDHLPGGTLWLPVVDCDYMQSIDVTGDRWIRETERGPALEHGTRRWLELLADGLDETTQSLHRSYAEEALCAAQHRALAREGYVLHRERLSQALTHPGWAERALQCDRVASYHDHPFYPTARAKSGFDDDDLRTFAPEFDPTFELNWLAVPLTTLTLTTDQPKFWPRLRDLGLPESLEGTHTALPVHPLTWRQLGDKFPLPEDTYRAPRRWLRVRPTLSVRTVVVVDRPDSHIKLPLTICTLGSLNLRLIKPSTIYDGHWFERVLTSIAEIDPMLRGRYLHADESHGGHVAEARHLTYLVRGYPSLPSATLIPVAALCGEMPDGRLLALHIADRFYGGDLLAWWREYASLLCEVHLRLWLAYGIALEANQQNAVLIYRSGQKPCLFMKDNDAARVLMPRLHSRLPQIESFNRLKDERIIVSDDTPLAQMFCTIILQLDLLAILEGVAKYAHGMREPMYAALREILHNTLTTLRGEGIDTSPAEALFSAASLPVKYLLSAGSLLSKEETGATDINKFYGESGPNFMLSEVVEEVGSLS